MQTRGKKQLPFHIFFCFPHVAMVENDDKKKIGNWTLLRFFSVDNSCQWNVKQCAHKTSRGWTYHIHGVRDTKRFNDAAWSLKGFRLSAAAISALKMWGKTFIAITPFPISDSKPGNSAGPEFRIDLLPPRLRGWYAAELRKLWIVKFVLENLHKIGKSTS